MSPRLLALAYSAFFFLGSLLIFPFFNGGDQISYRLFYSHASSMDIPTALNSYRETLSSTEPIYFYLVYICSRFIEKDILFSLINGALGYCMFFWLIEQRVNKYVIALLSLNFYVVVLLFSAERLKVAILFFALGILNRGILRYCFYGLSIFSHAQMLVLLINVQVKKVCSIISDFKSRKVSQDLLVLISILMLLGIGVFFMRSHIAGKIASYSRAGGFSSLLKPLFFLFLSVLVTQKDRTEAVLSHIPILLVAFFVGSDRLVIFSYFTFMYFGLKNKDGLNLPVLTTSMYFLVGGMFFIYKIVFFGDGFYDGASWTNKLLQLF